MWNAEYHHLAFLEEVMGSQSSMACSCCSFPVADDMADCAIVGRLSSDHGRTAANPTMEQLAGAR